MQNEELLLKLIFSNQLIFCGIFGALGGIVHTLDLRSSLNVSSIIQKIIVSASAGILLFFSTYEIPEFKPALRITAAIVAGFYGSAIFRKLAEIKTLRLSEVLLKASKAIDAANENDTKDRPRNSETVEDNDGRDH
jgi:uncharacterized membrane protein HdeD (DUF308 family)